MEFKDSKETVIWMLQHIGTTLWSIGADGKAYDWKLDRIVALNGAFPFNILFVCTRPRNKQEFVFQIGDIGKCLFITEDGLYQENGKKQGGNTAC